MYVRDNYDWPPWEDEEKDAFVVERGDEVSVDYIGTFIDGRVFDTNIQSVGTDEKNYTKSVTFNSDKSYSPLTFVVGAGSMVTGFEEGVMGMKKGETRSITVPSDKGYGEADGSLIYTLPVVDTVPLYQSLDRAEFDANYSQEVAMTGVTTSHHFWGWPVTIVSLDNETVTIENNPVHGENYKGFSWNTTITEISSETGEITLKHVVGTSLADEDSIITPESFRKYDNSLPPSANDKGTVWVENNEILIDFNREVVGKILIFEVTIKTLKKGE